MGIRGGSLALLLLASVLSLPLAAAAATTGEITTQGTAQFPQSSTATFPKATLFLNDTSQMETLSAAAVPGSLAHVCEYELQEAEIGLEKPIFHTPTPTNPPPRCYDASGFNVTLIPGDHAGWCGFHPAGGSWAVSPSGSVKVNPRDVSTLASEGADAGGSRSQDLPEHPVFLKSVIGPHVFAEETGIAIARGPVQMKCMGPDFRLTSATNASDYRTENTATSGPARERNQRWLVVDFDSAEIVIESRAAPFEIAAPEASVEWIGAARFTADAGTIRTDGAAYSIGRGEAITLEGQIIARVTPTLRADGLELTFQGDARSVSMGSVRIALPTAEASFPWAPVILGAAVVSVGTGALLLLRKRRRHPKPVARPAAPAEEAPAPPAAAPAEPPAVAVAAAAETPAAVQIDPEEGSAEAFAAQAQEAAEEGDWEAAVDFLNHALELAQEGVYHMERGAALMVLRRFSDARESFANAAEAFTDGEPEMKAAEAAMSEPDPDVEVAARWLLRALERPGLAARVLSVIATDPLFAPLRRREPIQDALDAALERQNALGWPKL